MYVVEPAPAPVVIASFRALEEAQVARSAVESAGIEVLMSNEHTVSIDWMYMNAIGGVKLVVAAEDADAALAVLQGIWPEGQADESTAPPTIDVERCPECGSQEFIRVRRLPFFIIFSTLMFGIGHAVGQFDLFALVVAIVAAVLVISPNRRCTACGRRWQGRAIAAPGKEERPVEPIPVTCPRCGSTETATIDRRRLKALTMLIVYLLPPLLFIWPFMPRRKCDECGLEWR